jgi:hypothetical protein
MGFNMMQEASIEGVKVQNRNSPTVNVWVPSTSPFARGSDGEWKTVANPWYGKGTATDANASTSNAGQKKLAESTKGKETKSTTTQGKSEETSSALEEVFRSIREKETVEEEETTTEKIVKKNMSDEQVKALDKLIAQMQGDGTPELQQMKADRQRATRNQYQLLAEVSPEMARRNAQALMDKQMKKAMEEGKPIISQAIEGAGMNSGTIQANMMNKLAMDAATAASALGAQQEIAFAEQRTALSSILEELTKVDPIQTKMLLQGLDIAKGSVENIDRTVTTGKTTTRNRDVTDKTNSTSSGKRDVFNRQNESSNTDFSSDKDGTEEGGSNDQVLNALKGLQGLSTNSGGSGNTFNLKGANDNWNALQKRLDEEENRKLEREKIAALERIQSGQRAAAPASSSSTGWSGYSPFQGTSGFGGMGTSGNWEKGGSTLIGG